MIRRYSVAEVSAIWSEENKYRSWLKVELEVCRELARRKVIPQSSWREIENGIKKIEKKGGLDSREIEEIEKTTRHDVIAFTTALSNRLGRSARFVHFGLTSSDVVDTALSMRLQESGQLVLSELKALIESLIRRSDQYASLPCIGRTHGVFAEPTVFGLKFLSFAAEMLRAYEAIERHFEEMRFGKLSGAVGVNAHFGVDFEKTVLKRLSLKREWVSTQVLPRDRLARVVSELAVLGAGIERMAIELRLLQRSEVGEVREGFQKGQKGSSAMPHKQNPISAENLTGCARMLRSMPLAFIENVALWHERDISHSSVERVFLPDMLHLTLYSIQRARALIDACEVLMGGVEKNLSAAGKNAFSGHYLLKLVEKNIKREVAYEWIQAAYLRSLKHKSTLQAELQSDSRVLDVLTFEEIENLGSIEYQTRNAKGIYTEFRKEYRRVLKRR